MSYVCSNCGDNAAMYCACCLRTKTNSIKWLESRYGIKSNEADRYRNALERIKALPIDDPRDEAPLIANAIATKALNQGDTK